MIQPYNKAEVVFDILEEIGFEGKNSKVYIAYDHHLGADLVIKKVQKKAFNGQEELFFEEAKTLYLSSHQNVVPVHYACKDPDHVYIALPYFQKGSLKANMAQKVFTVREIVRYASQFLSGLHNIHSKGLIHFDLKPDNILLSNNNEALVSDFGLAKHTNALGLASPDGFYNKHVPPEVLVTTAFTNAFDIYQVGLCLYRMCNGERDFEQQFAKYANPDKTLNIAEFTKDLRAGNFPDRTHFLEHIPEKLRKVIRKCLAVDPDERYDTVIDLTNDLSSIDGNELDWQFSENGQVRQWDKHSDNRVISITVDQNNKSHATKTIGARTSRIVDHCKDNLTRQELRRFLREN
ncbi:serine/threonine-protein kinase [Thiomicrorhabdus sp.]|uniref:serine/threonine-protein kinase n=1 Tax=Thiomicrorhabdus sp. TaxID=2039724 RepID=UPI003561827A